MGGRNVADGATEVIDARGGLVMPGFDDAHIHLRAGAGELERRRTSSGSRPRRRASRPRSAPHAAATPDAPWVLGRGWLYAAFPGGLPTAPSSTRSSPTDPRSWAASTATPAGRTRRRCAWPASTGRRPTRPTGAIVRDAATASRRARSRRRPSRSSTRRIPQPDRGRGPGRDPRARSPGSTRPGSPRSRTPWLDPDELALWRRIHDEDALPLRVRLAR